MLRVFACVTAFAAAAIGCSSSSSSSNTAGPTDASTAHADSGERVDAAHAADATRPVDGGAREAAAFDAGAIVAARPYTLHVPTSYQASQPAPLLVMFHGYGASGFAEETYYLDLTATSDAHGFLYAYGDGTTDKTGSRFWNATDACCDLYGIPVDDVQYFDAIVDDVSAKYDVDPKRVYVMGHSNGGFMAHRLACDRADRVAAVLSLEGAQWNDLNHCHPTGPVSVVEVHGDADKTILFDGGATEAGVYPSAPTTVSDWAMRNGCGSALASTGQTLDLVSSLPGNETTVESFMGCPAGVDVQLWRVSGGIHIPPLTHPGFGEAMWTFMSAHAKP